MMPAANLVFAQPQFAASPPNQAQFFIAGPNNSATTGVPFQQILIPLNPTQMNNAGTNGEWCPPTYISNYLFTCM